jgi:hypothetical protein
MSAHELSDVGEATRFKPDRLVLELRVVLSFIWLV